MFQDTKLELWKIESNVIEVEREMGEVEMQKDAIHVQFKEMERGGGLSFWPKPFLHPTMPIDSDVHIIILVFPCLFCKRSFNFYDIIVSCKHVYHPFCLGKAIKKGNKLFVCCEVFHPY